MLLNRKNLLVPAFKVNLKIHIHLSITLQKNHADYRAENHLYDLIVAKEFKDPRGSENIFHTRECYNSVSGPLPDPDIQFRPAHFSVPIFLVLKKNRVLLRL